ncbi:MAG: hypothetical protein JRC86_02700 [Deltaproteobacteria bacterium]|nr:hypothetical protein [Deltaproteobacteria bacterium]
MDETKGASAGFALSPYSALFGGRKGRFTGGAAESQGKIVSVVECHHFYL